MLLEKGEGCLKLNIVHALKFINPNGKSPVCGSFKSIATADGKRIYSHVSVRTDPRLDKLKPHLSSCLYKGIQGQQAVTVQEEKPHHTRWR